ncbi:MAG: thioredoxin family protein [Deltaproteobacteria bacterium]|nr:thioredoxin family protein [Deltaproteobacteria bacterium]
MRFKHQTFIYGGVLLAALWLFKAISTAEASKGMTIEPTLVEFGATGCVPCDMMQPVLDNLRKKYQDRLNIVFVHVGEEQILGARYAIASISVQAFFNRSGKEVFRHTGFFAQAEVEEKLVEMGVK